MAFPRARSSSGCIGISLEWRRNIEGWCDNGRSGANPISPKGASGADGARELDTG